MLPLQQSGELFFQKSSNHHNQQHKIPEDQILSSHHVSCHHETRRVSYSDSDAIKDCPKRRRNSCKKLKLCGSGSADDRKKMMHRDIERQRRQEMATLYASLRSLLPLEFIKGKRSISDQVNEAVNYIKHLQRNIKELSSKRDELTLLSGSSARNLNSNNSTNDINPGQVVVRSSLVGIEIVFSSSYGPHGCLRLSRVLQVLLEEGVCVVSCISSKADDRLIHAIVGEVNDPAGIDISDLQDRLTQLMQTV